LPKIPGITLHYEIARGGMGVVYSGRQDFLDRRVAVKFLSMDLGGEAFAQRFQREAKILAGISHPNIVGCHMADTTPEGQSYLVMEFCDGPSLKAWITENGPVEPIAAIRMIRASAMALAHAHQSDIIHRDVKPENILLESVTSTALDIRFPFTPKIVDLGLARMTHEQVGMGLTSPGSVMATSTVSVAVSTRCWLDTLRSAAAN
jgi:serine/threonine protein kinase